MAGKGKPPPAPRKPPAKRAGRTVDWGRDEEYVPVAKLDGAQQAILAGRCGRCDRPYAKGDWVFREEGELVGVNCCATSADTRPSTGDPLPLGLGDLTDAEDIDGRDWVSLEQVMPSGKTKRDMCPRCFQIPAANGVCGC